MQIELIYFKQKLVLRKQSHPSVVSAHLHLLFLPLRLAPIMIRIMAVIIKG